MNNLIIVGIGHPYRGDDAAGWVVIDGLETKIGSMIDLIKQQGDLADLLDLFNRYHSVYLVDACRSNQPTGSWQRIDLHQQRLPADVDQTSTHGFGIQQAVALAKSFNQLPSRLILYAIQGENYSMSHGLSPLVAQSAQAVIEAILSEEEVKRCMNRV